MQLAEYVDASFYQIARGLVLPFTVLFSWFLLKTHSSPATLGAVGLVCLGFFFGVSSENLHASSIGIALGVASSVTTAVHAIVVKRSLPIVDGQTLDLVYYSNLLSAGVIAPFVLLSGEAWVVADMVMGVGNNTAALKTFLFGAAITVSTISIFQNTILTFFRVYSVSSFASQVSSQSRSPHLSLAHGLSRCVVHSRRVPMLTVSSSAVRGVLQTFLGIWLFGDIVGAGRGFGIVFILGGSIFYVYTKSIAEPPRPASPEVSK